MTLTIDATSSPGIMQIYGTGMDFPPFAPPHNALFYRQDEGKLFRYDAFASDWSELPPAETASQNVVSYGARGQGADDTAGLQAAVDYVDAQGGGTVYCPKGNYRL